jgi:hypothetical protein
MKVRFPAVFLYFDLFDMSNSPNLTELVQYSRKYVYYRELAIDDNYLFAFSDDPFTSEEALNTWKK